MATRLPGARASRPGPASRTSGRRAPRRPSARQFGQSPVPQYSPRRRWYFKDRENVRIPDRYSADAIVSPSSTVIRFRPSRSLPRHLSDLVRRRVARDRDPPPAAEEMEPTLVLRAGRVPRQEHPREVSLHVGRLDRPELPAPGELGRRRATRSSGTAPSAPRARRPRRRSRSAACDAPYPGAPVTPPPGCAPAPHR